MALTHRIIRTFIGTNGTQITAEMSQSAGQELNVSEVIPALSSDLLVALTLDVSQIKSLYIKATGGAMTLETNSGGSPANTITLAANGVEEWQTGDNRANPLTTDVTALYVTSTAGGTLEIRVLIDPTV
jgi:hypothetical protein